MHAQTTHYPLEIIQEPTAENPQAIYAVSWTTPTGKRRTSIYYKQLITAETQAVGLQMKGCTDIRLSLNCCSHFAY